MDEREPRLLVKGLIRKSDHRGLSIFLVCLFLAALAQPVTADLSVKRDDFGVLEALAETLEKRKNSGESLVAIDGATQALALVDANARTVESGDAIVDAQAFLDDMEMRETTPLVAQHPRPYQFLLDSTTQPDGLPANLWQTLFSIDNFGVSNLLGFGLNSYVIYMNFTSRNNGPSYEAWEYGTFTGELLVGTDLVLFENYIDVDGDTNSDVSVALTLNGLTTFGEGWGVEFSDGLIPVIDELWISPTFQWEVDVINPNDLLWENLERLEVSMMKGLAFDITLSNAESYAIVVDTSFTQPPHEASVGVGIEELTFDVNAIFTSVADLLFQFGLGNVNSSDLSLTSISAPYAISVRNPNAPGTSRQTDCEDDSHYDKILDHGAVSRQHKCSLGIGVGYIHFDEVQDPSNVDVLELAYLDVGFHPEYDRTFLPSEVDITLRNDNIGKNSFDTVEIFSDTGIDVYLHYYEDRSEVPEGDSPYGNVTDSRAWIRGLPSGTMHPDEIEAIFTMIGEEPSNSNFPGELPNRLSLIVAIKNFTGDQIGNVNDPTLPVNPANPPNTLIVIAGTEQIERLIYHSTFKRAGYESDSSSIQLDVEMLPRVIVIQGSFTIPSTGLSRVNFNNPNLNSIAQIFDNALLTLVEVVLDIGAILNGLPNGIVGTAGSSGGEVDVSCWNQVKQSLPSSSRQPESLGTIAFAFGSSTHPVMANTDHVLLSQDALHSTVYGRLGPQDPLVPVAMSMRMSGINHVRQYFDPSTEIRDIMFEGSNTESLLLGYVYHEGTNIDDAIKQAAIVSNRPTTLQMTQTPVSLEYEASSPIGTITYGGSSDNQQNAIRLDGLPSNFSLILGETIGYSAQEPMSSIQIQMSNASEHRTMDGDHFRYWVNNDTKEASLSVQISNITSVQRLSPLVPGSSGPEGNSIIELARSSSSPFSVLFEDESDYDNPFLGLNGRVHINPLPADISLAFPSGINSNGIELPSFGDQEGIQGVSFFLSDVVEVGNVINDFVYQMTNDLAGVNGDEQTNISFGLDLVTGEKFDVVADLKKGDNIPDTPDWQHGIGVEAVENTYLEFNLTRMPTFTLSNRQIMENILEDGAISLDERAQAATIVEFLNITGGLDLIFALEDGKIFDTEIQGLNFTLLDEQGVTIIQRRSWHLRAWLPSLPSGAIDMAYQYTFEDGVPIYQIDISLSQWQPEREQFSMVINGLQGRDIDLVIDGFDTSKSNDVLINARFSTQDNFSVPRFTFDLHYDIGMRLNSAHVLLVDHQALSRVEALVMGIPQSTDVSATIGDILILDLTVPEEFRIDGHSADSLMIQQMRYVDGFWWPSTAFMRNLPGEMHLSTLTDSRFDIREQIAFQGMRTLDYSSNTDDMDLYLEAFGRAIDSKGNTLMLAENLPQRFVLSPTEDYGLRIASSGKGVERVYLKQTDMPSSPGVTIKRVEVIGQYLSGATIHIHSGPMQYPIIIIDDITTGRIVASAEAYVEPGEMYPVLEGFDLSGRAVLLDAQFTGVLPTASSFGINGIVTDLSIVGELTGQRVETRHILVVEPLTTLVISGLSMIMG